MIDYPASFFVFKGLPNGSADYRGTKFQPASVKTYDPEHTTECGCFGDGEQATPTFTGESPLILLGVVKLGFKFKIRPKINVRLPFYLENSPVTLSKSHADTKRQHGNVKMTRPNGS